jgi:hypothetical protein
MASRFQIKKISIDTLVSLAQIISSVALVVSIIYIAVEYKKSDVLSNKDVENQLYNNIRTYDQLVIENEDVAKLIIKATTQPDSLKPEEVLRYVAWEHIFFDSWESAWSQYKEGILEHETWSGWNEWFISEALKKPLVAWEGNRKNYNGEFLIYVDEIILNR